VSSTGVISLQLFIFHTQLIEIAVKERFNDSASTVIRSVLKATEEKQKSLGDVRSGV
jgi:hypothetical protein